MQNIWLETCKCETTDKIQWPSERQRSYVVILNFEEGPKSYLMSATQEAYLFSNGF